MNDFGEKLGAAVETFLATEVLDKPSPQAIPEAAVEALARVLAEEALFKADVGGRGWDAETDSSDHFMPSARKSAARYLEAAHPHIHRTAWNEGFTAARAMQDFRDTL